jgi:hypothetical protein
VKSKDMKTDGTVYYYTTTDTWMKWSHQADKAVIIDNRAGRWGYTRDRETGISTWTHRPGGQDVLIEIPARGGNAARRLAVRSASIRGTWDECVELLARVKQARQQAASERKQQLEAVAGPCHALARALDRIGVAASTDESERYLHANVVIHYQQAPKLLAAVQHLIDSGWTPPTAD